MLQNMDMGSSLTFVLKDAFDPFAHLKIGRVRMEDHIITTRIRNMILNNTFVM